MDWVLAQCHTVLVSKDLCYVLLVLFKNYFKIFIIYWFLFIFLEKERKREREALR